MNKDRFTDWIGRTVILVMAHNRTLPMRKGEVLDMDAGGVSLSSVSNGDIYFIPWNAIRYLKEVEA